MNDLRDPRSLTELIVRDSPDAVAVVSASRAGHAGRECVLWSHAMAQLTGRSADAVVGRRLEDVFPRLGEKGIAAAITRALGGETVVEHALPEVFPDGIRRYFDRFYKPLRDDSGEVVGAVITLRDVTAQRQTEEALRASEERVRLAVASAGVGLWSWNRVTDEVRWEDTLCAIFGLPPGSSPVGHDGYVALIHPDDRARRAESIARGVVAGHWEDEYRLFRSDTGALRWVMSKGSVIGDVAVGAVIDVTERRERDAQMLQSQKLEAVGQLTAGIAHNFNNALMGILANLDLAARDAPASLAPLLHEAEQSAERAAHIVRELMTYAGRNRARARSLEAISLLVERTVAFCRTTFDRRIVFDTEYDGGARARVDPGQIEQALLNTLINARDAIEGVESEAPRISVRVDILPEGAAELGVRAGAFVRVRIADNGTGIDPATASRLFEPFFTTKPAGKGTGLGLATTLTIASEHGGFVTCDGGTQGDARSGAPKGATFSLYLPSAAIAANPTAPSPVRETSPVRGTETILVVDDDRSIRRLVFRILERAGFQVMAAASGDEALQLLADPRAAAEVALALLDVSMPGIPRPELRRRLGAVIPQARIVYLSGYAFEATEPDDVVLEKPVSEARLLGTLRDVLDRRPSAQIRAANRL